MSVDRDIKWLNIYKGGFAMREYDFEEVLELFESHGWKLQRTQGEYRIFKDYKGNDKLPWPIPVNKRKVDIYYVEKFKEYIKNTR
jgi:hypothetical protein